MGSSRSRSPASSAAVPVAAAIVGILLGGPAATPLAAQVPAPPEVASNDTATFRPHGEPFFTSRDAWIALGFVAGTLALAPLDQRLARELQDSTVQAHDVFRGAADTFRFLGFPGTAIIGGTLYAVGRIGDIPAAAKVGLRGTEAVVLSYAFVWTGKNLLGRARPDRDPDDPFNFEFARGFHGGSDFRSFPSGHSAGAFAFAAAVSSEVRVHWPGAAPFATPALYVGATLVAASRMYHNRHWASDVLIGAGIGTFSGLKVVQYHHRNPDSFVDRWLLPTALAPTDSGYLFLWRVPVGPSIRSSAAR